MYLVGLPSILGTEPSSSMLHSGTTSILPLTKVVFDHLKRGPATLNRVKKNLCDDFSEAAA